MALAGGNPLLGKDVQRERAEQLRQELREEYQRCRRHELRRDARKPGRRGSHPLRPSLAWRRYVQAQGTDRPRIHKSKVDDGGLQIKPHQEPAPLPSARNAPSSARQAPVRPRPAASVRCRQMVALCVTMASFASCSGGTLALRTPGVRC